MQIGCLQSNTNVTRLNTNTVTISLTDKQLIDDIQHLFPFFNKGSFDYSKYNPNSKMQYYLRKKNKKLYAHLFNAGIIPRKSTENSEKLFIPKFNSDLLRHFIRGYFDGNGSISIPKVRPNLRRVDLCTTSLTFIKGVIEELNKMGINTPIFREKNKTPDKNKILYVIEWVNTKDILALKDYLYTDATIFLKRKKSLFDSFNPIAKITKNPVCYICGFHLTKNGTRKNLTGTYCRYKCKECGIHTQQLIPSPN